MRRLIAFVVLLGLFCAVAIAGPAERFTRADAVSVFNSSRGWVPSYNGVPFRPDKLTINLYGTATTSECTLTVYIPVGSGPATASDSLVMGFYTTSRTFVYDYYGPISDTLRLKTNSTGIINIIASGW